MWKNCSGAISVALTAATLAGCADETQEGPDAAASLRLEPLGAPDIEKHEIYGTVCGFREAGGSIRALALVQPGQAWIKLNGEAIALPVTDGEGEGPLDIGLAYGSERATLSLSPEGDVQASGGGRTEVGSVMTVRTPDDGGAELSGSLQCSAGSV